MLARIDTPEACRLIGVSRVQAERSPAIPGLGKGPKEPPLIAARGLDDDELQRLPAQALGQGAHPMCRVRKSDDGVGMPFFDTNPIKVTKPTCE